MDYTVPAQINDNIPGSKNVCWDTTSESQHTLSLSQHTSTFISAILSTRVAENSIGPRHAFFQHYKSDFSFISFLFFLFPFFFSFPFFFFLFFSFPQIYVRLLIYRSEARRAPRAPISATVLSTLINMSQLSSTFQNSHRYYCPNLH